MSRKIIGVTVGTTMNPQKIAEKVEGGTSLPMVTEQDNGKVLKAQGGQWVAEENDAEKFGGQLPDYYAAKSELPSKVSQLENDEGYLKEHQSLEDYAKKSDIPDVPTKVSELENDKGYLTEHQSLEEYAKKDEIPTNVSELENDAGYLTEHQSLEEYAKKSEIPEVPENVSAFNNDAGYLTEHQDLSEYAKRDELPKVPTKVSAFENDKGYLTEHQSLDNYYTKPEITDKLNKKQETLDKYVESVNGYSGEVKLTAADVQALPNTTVIPTVPTAVSAFANDADYASKTYVSEIAGGKCQAYTFETVDELDTWLGNDENTAKLNNGDVFYIRAVGVPDYWWDKQTQSKCILETTKVELGDYAKKAEIPTKTSQITNDSGYISTAEVDIKLADKQEKLTEYVSTVNGKSGAVTLTCTDVGAMPANTPIPTVPTKLSAFDNDAGYAKTSDIPTALSQLSQDATHRIVTDTEKAAWNAKSNFSGNYNDLSNKPTIPTVPSSLPANGGNADTVDNYHIRTGTAGAAGYITFVV